MTGASANGKTNFNGAPASRLPSIVEGNQAARCSGSVTTRHTFSRACGRSRTKVSRAVVVSIFSSVPCSVGFIEMPFQVVEGRGPQRPVRGQPRVEFAQRFGSYPV